MAQAPFISPKAIADYFEKPKSAETIFHNNPTHATKPANMPQNGKRYQDMGFSKQTPQKPSYHESSSNHSASPVVEAVFYELPSPSDLMLGLKAWNNGANSIRKLQQALDISYPKARGILQQLAADGLINWNEG